jgi:SpoU rRNA methylase family enzyme
MENTQELLTDVLVADETTVDVVANEVEETQPETEFSLDEELMKAAGSPNHEGEQSALDMLIARRTGFYPIKLDIADLKWIKNSCNSGKFTFIGPNEAFMVMNCFMGVSAAIARLEQEKAEKMESTGSVEMQAAAVEAAAILLNKYEGSGLESAQRVFRIAIALNGPVMEMKQLDQIINQLKIEEAKQDELAKQAEADNTPVNPS